MQHNIPAGNSLARYGLFAAWVLLLLLPSATVFTTAPWDAEPKLLLAATAGFFALLWLVIGGRWFFVLTYPLAFLGVLIVAADMLRGVNLVEIAMLSGRVEIPEAREALAPYAIPMAVTAILLAAAAAVLFRSPPRMPAPRVRIGAIALLAAIGAAGLALAPITVLRAWPLNIASLQVAIALGRTEFIATALPYASVNPRSASATWSAKRVAAPPDRETYVLVIGESVRADRLAACGGRAFLKAPDGAVVYCNVTSGSSSTHTSVPLLVSREMPGRPHRVSTDATALHAFQETGFRTYWLSVQPQSVAWPDAQVARYSRVNTTARRDLLPFLRAALADPAPRKMIVLHSYDAHFNYCQRYPAAEAPIAVDCERLGELPTRATRAGWMDAYDDAIAETMKFLDAVIRETRASGGETFVVYTSDHGENLLDDDRDLVGHALNQLTRFDTRVPAIFWASDAWRANHPEQARALGEHRNVAAMHADLVPTLLGAAGIAYAEPRREIVDLTRVAPGPRTRWVSRRLGQAEDADRLH